MTLTKDDIRHLKRIAHTLMSDDANAPASRRVAHVFKEIAARQEQANRARASRWVRSAEPALMETLDRLDTGESP